MRHLDLDVYEPGDAVATVSKDGVVTVYTVQADGSLGTGGGGLGPTDPIEELGLSVRPYNVLKREGVHTISRLLEVYDDGSLFEFRNLGSKAADEITAKVQAMHLSEGGPLKR